VRSASGCRLYLSQRLARTLQADSTPPRCRGMSGRRFSCRPRQSDPSRAPQICPFSVFTSSCVGRVRAPPAMIFFAPSSAALSAGAGFHALGRRTHHFQVSFDVLLGQGIEFLFRFAARVWLPRASRRALRGNFRHPRRRSGSLRPQPVKDTAAQSAIPSQSVRPRFDVRIRISRRRNLTVRGPRVNRAVSGVFGNCSN